MKILLLHFEDDPDGVSAPSGGWDQIADLGMGGSDTYEHWSLRFDCPVTAVRSLRNGFEDFRRIRDLLGAGCGQLIDEHGLDWWELISILLHGELETLILLQRFVSALGSGDEVFVSRPGVHASLLQALLPKRVHVFPLRQGAEKRGLRHYLRVSRRLSLSQMVDVFWDKCDLGYQFRGRLTRKPPPSKGPVTLLPTAYVNVSRTGIAYANTFPEENFLLVSTRRSGWVRSQPRNVAAARLSSYASLGGRDAENAKIEGAWQSLRKKLRTLPEFEILNQAGYLGGFSRHFRHGLAVRDAWRNVLDSEPVQAVLCADDSNPYTRIPLLLAQARGLANIACHHGALDGRYFFKRSYADLVWAKGKMEQDYLVRKCSVPQDRVEIAAPASPTDWQGMEKSNRDIFRPHILFISEAYEAGGGRAKEFYRDILPLLANLALSNRRTLIVKLHPGESKHERGGMLASILSPQQKTATRIVTGPITEDLLANAWFGITVLSTVATECAMRGVPCFLCRWLESWPYGYVDQFIRFGVGIGLNDPSEIQNIPEYLQKYEPSAEARENCYQRVAPGHLRELLSASSRREFTAVVG